MEGRYCLNTVEVKDKWKCGYKTECFVKVSKGQGKQGKTLISLMFHGRIQNIQFCAGLALKNKGDNESEGVNLNNMMNETSTHPELLQMLITHSIKAFRAHFPKL